MSMSVASPFLMESDPQEPLDLSAPKRLSPMSTGHCSVIKAISPTANQPLHQELMAAFPPVFQRDSKPTLLPTCANPNLNSNWMAMKFGAAVGPNRMSYPREFKLMVIDYYYANGQNKYRTCKEFQITKSMLNGWLQKIDKIRQSRPGSLKSGRSGRRPQFPDIEKQLYSLYQAHLVSAQKVGNRWIRETARNLAKQQCSQEELGGMCQFSERWLSNFKKRYRINLNRDWSGGSSATGSSASSTSSGPITDPDPEEGSESQPGDSHENAALLSPVEIDADETMEPGTAEEKEVDGVQTTHTILDHSVAEEAVPAYHVPANPLNPPQINRPSLLPVQQFYRQYPWLCRKTTGINYEPGRRGRKVQFPQVEKVLYERLLRRQASGSRVSNRWLQEEARGLAAQLCPEVLAEATKSARCMFSEHWLHNFKKRYGVSLKHQMLTNPAAPTGARSKTSSPRPPSQSTDATPQQPTAAPPATVGAQPNNHPAALAAFLQMQHWILQHCYLSSVARQQQYYKSSVSTEQDFKPNIISPVQNSASQAPRSAEISLAEWYNAKNLSAQNVLAANLSHASPTDFTNEIESNNPARLYINTADSTAAV